MRTVVLKPCELGPLYRLRYRELIERQGLQLPERDDEQGMLCEPIDAYSYNLAAREGAEILLSTRVTPLAGVPRQIRESRFAHHECICSGFPAGQISLVSRFMATPTGLRHLQPFLNEVLELHWREGFSIALGDCSPDLLPFYLRLGFIATGKGFDDPLFGLKVPIAMALWDSESLAESGAPVAERSGEHRLKAVASGRWISRKRLLAVSEFKGGKGRAGPARPLSPN